ncbi:MAG: NADH-quinone oxidoreductase subunit NuoG [Pseudomonadales bacterium]|nr:NADH-quinone oxidoreductase subunit NuoG [Pseudomonadales bacterium]
MAKIVIDGVTYEVNGDNNLLQECLSKGLDLPYFCWHPCMGSVGACRQCAVKQYRDADDQKGTLVMACMTKANDGSIISIEDEEAKKFRANVIESLMISHPHDCPVCEEGGECHLQDMTLMSGHNYRRYDRKKVTHRNQYLGPFVGHEMNRCITCYRCVRFYDDYAGGTDLAAQASHHHTYFGRQSDGFLESEFSGNLVEVCPTGVFTDATFSAHYSRKWDLQTAPSVCVGCAVGCNTTPGERYGELRRIVNRYHGDVNGYFLCDRGRFGYGFVNSAERLAESQQGKGTGRRTVSEDEAVLELNRILDGGQVIGIGSPRASVEANLALLQRVGGDNFYAGVSDAEFAQLQILKQLSGESALHAPSVREIEECDAVLVLGEDVTNTAPRIALALRQSARNRADELAAAAGIPSWQDAAVRELAQRELSPVYLLSGYATRLDDIARATVVDSAPGLTQLAQALARTLDSAAPTPAATLQEEQKQLLGSIADDLKGARRPLIVCGTGSGSEALLKAAANVARALATARGGDQAVDFCCVVPEVNSVGLVLMAGETQSLGLALKKMQAGDVQAAVVLENDLFGRAPQSQVEAALAGVGQLVAIDQLPTRTTELADLVIAGTSFAEQQGTYINYEGRAQTSMQVFMNNQAARPAWKWLRKESETTLAGLLQTAETTLEGLAGITAILPVSAAAVAGMKYPRQSHRYSGRTAIQAAANVHEGKQPEDRDSIMAFSMEGMSSQRDTAVLPNTWAPRWNSNQSVSKFLDEVGGHLRQGNPGRLLFTRNGSSAGYFEPESAAVTTGDFTLIPAYQLYGSDELSARAEVVNERLTGAYVALAPHDAQQLGVAANDLVTVSAGQEALDYPVCIRRSVKPGTIVAFTPAGQFPVAGAGDQVSLSKAQGSGQARFGNLIVSDLQQEGI